MPLPARPRLIERRLGSVKYEEYHPYGSTAWHAFDASKGVSAKRYRYTGMERDEETGLQCHGVRYYAPWLGRWMSADPIGLGDGGNRYRYVQCAPVGARDSDGKETSRFDATGEPTYGAPDPINRVAVEGAKLAESDLSSWFSSLGVERPQVEYVVLGLNSRLGANAGTELPDLLSRVGIDGDQARAMAQHYSDVAAQGESGRVTIHPEQAPALIVLSGFNAMVEVPDDELAFYRNAALHEIGGHVLAQPLGGALGEGMAEWIAKGAGSHSGAGYYHSPDAEYKAWGAISEGIASKVGDAALLSVVTDASRTYKPQFTWEASVVEGVRADALQGLRDMRGSISRKDSQRVGGFISAASDGWTLLIALSLYADTAASAQGTATPEVLTDAGVTRGPLALADRLVRYGLLGTHQ